MTSSPNWAVSTAEWELNSLHNAAKYGVDSQLANFYTLNSEGNSPAVIDTSTVDSWVSETFATCSHREGSTRFTAVFLNPACIYSRSQRGGLKRAASNLTRQTVPVCYRLFADVLAERLPSWHQSLEARRASLPEIREKFEREREAERQKREAERQEREAERQKHEVERQKQRETERQEREAERQKHEVGRQKQREAVRQEREAEDQKREAKRWQNTYNCTCC